MVGRARDAVCFSFHPRKIITTGEGGAIATDDEQLASELRALRHHYMSVPDTVRHSSGSVIFEQYLGIGTNARMSDLQAAVGVVQMRRVGDLLERRRSLAARYDELLTRDIGWLRPTHCPPDRTHSYVSYVARVTGDAPVSRDGLMHSLLARGVATRPGIMCAHLQPAYRTRFGAVSLPHSEAATRDTVILPLYPQMTDDDIGRVNAALTGVEREVETGVAPAVRS